LKRKQLKRVLPTFIIPGANKSGTSYAAQILGYHPDIFMSYSKEPSFFSTHKKFGQYNRGIDFYYKNFVDYKGEKHIGEASTVYMYDPRSPELIHRHLGNIHLIFVLRDPIDRVYSNYWQSIKGGLDLPDFKTFIRSDHSHSKELIDVSRYDIHLSRYFEYFPHNRVLIRLFDQLKGEPVLFFNAVTEFLNLKPMPESIDYGKKVNPSSIPRSKIMAKALKYRPFIQTIKEIIPAQWGPIFRNYLVKSRKLVQVPFTYPEIDPESKKFLIDELYDTIENLEGMLDIDLTIWKSKYI
jgi:hypothetical protein